MLLRASCRAAPANLPARRRGWPSRVSGETSVVSTASWAPFHRGRPLAMTSMRRSSCWWGWLCHWQRDSDIFIQSVVYEATLLTHYDPVNS